MDDTTTTSSNNNDNDLLHHNSDKKNKNENKKYEQQTNNNNKKKNNDDDEKHTTAMKKKKKRKRITTTTTTTTTSSMVNKNNNNKNDNNTAVGGSRSMNMNEDLDPMIFEEPGINHYHVSYMHNDTITHVVISSKHGYIITASNDGIVKFWKRLSSVVVGGGGSLNDVPQNNDVNNNNKQNNNNNKTTTTTPSSSTCIEFVKSYTAHRGTILSLCIDGNGECATTKEENNTTTAVSTTASSSRSSNSSTGNGGSGDTIVSVGIDDIIKFYDVRTFDVIAFVDAKKEKKKNNNKKNFNNNNNNNNDDDDDIAGMLFGTSSCFLSSSAGIGGSSMSSSTTSVEGIGSSSISSSNPVVAISSRMDGSIYIYDTSGYLQTIQLHGSNIVTSMVHNTNYGCVLSMDSKGIIELWDAIGKVVVVVVDNNNNNNNNQSTTTSNSSDGNNYHDDDDDDEFGLLSTKATKTTTTLSYGGACTTATTTTTTASSRHGITYISKMETDLYALLRVRTYGTYVTVSSNGQYYAIVCHDDKIRIVQHHTAKILITLDMNDDIVSKAILMNNNNNNNKDTDNNKESSSSSSTSRMVRMDSIEHGKRLAVEREIRTETNIFYSGLTTLKQQEQQQERDHTTTTTTKKNNNNNNKSSKTSSSSSSSNTAKKKKDVVDQQQLSQQQPPPQRMNIRFDPNDHNILLIPTMLGIIVVDWNQKIIRDKFRRKKMYEKKKKRKKLKKEKNKKKKEQDDDDDDDDDEDDDDDRQQDDDDHILGIIGRADASQLRFLTVCPAWGDAKTDQQMQLARKMTTTTATSNMSSTAVYQQGGHNKMIKKNDSLLIATAYQQPRRLYIFSHYDPISIDINKNKNKSEKDGDNSVDDIITRRDVWNEQPTPQDRLLYHHHHHRTTNKATANTTTGTNAADVNSNKFAVLRTTFGDITIQLYPKQCPVTIENFIGHIQSGYYDGLLFHRVISGFMIQTGDPLGDGTGGESIWGTNFDDEFVTETLRHDRPGTVSMANSGPNTNGSQFFITTVPTPWLDNKHTIFGRVISGMDICMKIESVKTDEHDKPMDDIRIVNIDLKSINQSKIK